MSRKTYSVLLIAAGLFLGGFSASAQSGEYGSFTPYSVFGVGDLSSPGSAYNAGMAGVGIATRNHRYLNTVNPAAISARDSLAMMLDFTIDNANTLYRQNYGGETFRSGNNRTNVSSFAMSFPIWNKLSAAVGLRPYSSVGYKYKIVEDDPAMIANNGSISYSANGLGSLYNVFGAASWAIGKRLSVGAEADYIFGKVEKSFAQDFSASAYNEVQDKYTLNLNSLSGKFGLQYEQPIGKDWKIGVGATYFLSGRLKGYIDYASAAVGSVESLTIDSFSDTLGMRANPIYLANEAGLGISVNYADKFRAELNYLRADWTKSGMDLADGFATADAKLPMATTVKESWKLGFEYVPNINDVRYYYRKMAYRAGAYFNKEYFTLAGQPVNSAGITLGVTLPVFRWYNGVSITMDAGQRGGLQNGMVRERYIKFSVGVNLFDIWFVKTQYQ